MDGIRIAGGGMIVCCGFLTGVFGGERLRERVSFFEQYLLFLTRTEAMIGYTAAEAETLLEQSEGLPLLRPLLQGCLILLQQGEPLERAWRRAVNGHVRCKEDRRLLYSFGEAFGTTNAEGELAKTALHRQCIEQYYDRLSGELAVRRRLYRVLGTFGGVLTAVMLL